MGRPLKIQKTSPGSGSGGASVGVDLAYPTFESLTNPVYNSSATLEPSQYLGVVGGAAPTDAPSATYPRLEAIVNVANPSGVGLGVAVGYIIRQKGAHKYLVGATTGVNDGSLLVGQAYQISTLGTTTNWAAAGAASNAALGDIFTATNVGGSGNGVAFSVGICALDNDSTPAAGLMSLVFSTGGDSTGVFVSKLTNKFVLDWAGGSNYAADSVVNNVRYAANFFTDMGTVIKSGTTGAENVSGQQNLLSLAQLESTTA